MALERNKTAFQFEAGIDPEFERMLRRHLKAGGSMVAACSGFDADLASAFLEHALPESVRSQYQLHLAGCAACRRQLIELSRLFDSCEAIPAFATEYSPVNVASGWKRTLAGWLDLSRWLPAWNLQTAGLATASILLVAVCGVAIERYRHAGNAPLADISAINNKSTGQEAVAERVGSVQGAGMPAPLELQEERAIHQSTTDRSQSAQASPIPAPTLRPATPVPGGLDLVGPFMSFSSHVAMPPTAFTSQPAAPVPAVPLVGGSLAHPAADERAESARVADRVGEPEKLERMDAKADHAMAASPSANIIVPQVPFPDYNPMDREEGPEGSREKKAKKDEKTISRRERFIAGALSFLPIRKEGPAAKPMPVGKDNESFRRMQLRIHDRVFEFHSDKNIWIDQKYEANMAWRVTRLVRGSEEYNRLLKDEPELKHFFAKESILVIWGQKIFKVVPK